MCARVAECALHQANGRCWGGSDRIAALRKRIWAMKKPSSKACPARRNIFSAAAKLRGGHDSTDSFRAFGATRRVHTCVFNAGASTPRFAALAIAHRRQECSEDTRAMGHENLANDSPLVMNERTRPIEGLDRHVRPGTWQLSRALARVRNALWLKAGARYCHNYVTSQVPRLAGRRKIRAHGRDVAVSNATSASGDDSTP